MTFPSRGTPRFWELYRMMPMEIRVIAEKNYRIWKTEPFHPSLHFKKVGGGKWSLRLGIDYRAIGIFQDGVFVWDWIGSHSDYNRFA